MSIYCVYITHIHDVTRKLPTFYIGSSSVDKVNEGYHGSVSSNTYSKLFKKFIKEHPTDITTHILSYHETRKEATQAELELQIKHDVVKSEVFVNRALAKVKGCFGMEGPFSEEHCAKLSFAATGRHVSNETRSKISVKLIGKKHSKESREKMSAKRSGENNPMWGRERDFSKEHCAKISAGVQKVQKITCPHCKRDFDPGNYAQHHGDKCKYKT